MAISDPNAIRFCDQKVRPAADQLAKLYYLASRFLDEFASQQFGNIFLKDSEVIQDKAATDGDGRPIITGLDVNNIVDAAQAIRDQFEADGSDLLKRVLRVGVNTQP